jgi:hypothetical protein
MGFFTRFFGHLKTVLVHKYWVLYYASKLGYTWRGLVHDLSKFSPAEFFEGVKYWDGQRSPVLVAKELNGISYAWLHHRGHNKHHYEYWVEKLDYGGVPHKIPFKYVVEIVCDWLGACRAYNHAQDKIFKKEYEWWGKQKLIVKMHSDTKYMISRMLWNLCEYEEAGGMSEKEALRLIKMRLPVWEAEYNDPTNKLREYYEDTHV